MDHDTLVDLIDFWRASFFIEPVVVLTFIFCFIVGLRHHNRNKERLFFTAYFLIGVILFVNGTMVFVGKILTDQQLTIYREVTNTVFEIAELLAFYVFFKKCLQKNTYQKYLKLLLYLLLTSAVIFFISLTFPNHNAKEIIVHSFLVNTIEFFCLFIMCLTYFRELFTDLPTKNLFKRPSFLIVTSTFFYCILMIPFFAIANYLYLNETEIYKIVFACHYVLLVILLLSISKAFLCKTPITT